MVDGSSLSLTSATCCTDLVNAVTQKQSHLCHIYTKRASTKDLGWVRIPVVKLFNWVKVKFSETLVNAINLRTRRHRILKRVGFTRRLRVSVGHSSIFPYSCSKMNFVFSPNLLFLRKAFQFPSLNNFASHRWIHLLWCAYQGYITKRCLSVRLCPSVSVSNTMASTSSGSSDTGMSPSSASPTQNTVVVECRWWHAHPGLLIQLVPSHHRFHPVSALRAR